MLSGGTSLAKKPKRRTSLFWIWACIKKVIFQIRSRKRSLDIIYFFAFQNDLQALLHSRGTEPYALRMRLVLYVLWANISRLGYLVGDPITIFMGCHFRQNYLFFPLFFLFLVIMWCFNCSGLNYTFVHVNLP